MDAIKELIARDPAQARALLGATVSEQALDEAGRLPAPLPGAQAPAISPAAAKLSADGATPLGGERAAGAVARLPSQGGAARRLLLLQALRENQADARMQHPEGPTIAAAPGLLAGVDTELKAAGHGETAIRSLRARQTALGAPPGHLKAEATQAAEARKQEGGAGKNNEASREDTGVGGEPAAPHLIIGHGDRMYYLAMAALAVGGQVAVNTVPDKDWASTAVAPTSRVACQLRNRRRGQCDPSDPNGCGGRFCLTDQDDSI
ncbi:MAG: hypothetical protein V4754_19070 [Pseudomonadota bacterium]